MADQIGRVLGGRYQLVEPLGRGRSAQAFVADDVRLQRQVTVKLLHRRLAGDAEFLRRFRSEAQAAAALSHPHILAIYDWGEDSEGTPWLVTEHLGGGSLRGLLDRGHRLTPSQALVVGLQAARGLDHAHREGVVHRDVRPANLLFGDDGRLRVADFGLARALSEATASEPSEALATAARYASPEQARGVPLTDRADVYSLALTMVEAVTGVVPFALDTTLGTLMARVDRHLEVPAALGPLAAPVAAAAAPDLHDRPSAGALAVALARAAPSLPRPGAMPLAGPAGAELADTRVAPAPPGPPRPGPVSDPTRSWRPPGDAPVGPPRDPVADATVPRAPSDPPASGDHRPAAPIAPVEAGSGSPDVEPSRPPVGAPVPLPDAASSSTPSPHVGAASGPSPSQRSPSAPPPSEPPLDLTRVGGPQIIPPWRDDDEDERRQDGEHRAPRWPTGRRRRWPRRVAGLLAVAVVVAMIVLLVADLADGLG